MKYSEFFISTLKEAPGEEENESLKLMLRSGLLRKVAAGVYCYLPVGYKVLNKIENILRQEIKSLKANEILCPNLVPLELSLKEDDKEENFCFKDRSGRGFALGTSYERMIFDILKGEIKSYKTLPVMFYCIENEFRDERRPKAGLLRSREFRTLNLFSFNKSKEEVLLSIDKIHKALEKFFKKLDISVVKARNDFSIKGDVSYCDFIIDFENGEYNYITCKECGYISGKDYTPTKIDYMKEDKELNVIEKISTPNIRTIEELVSFLQTSPSKFAKTLIYKVEGKSVAVMVRGDREVNENKVKEYLKASCIELADDKTILEVTGAQVGFAGPVGLKTDLLLVDNEIPNMRNIIVGANDTGYHLVNVNYGRDFDGEVGDFRNITDKDTCPVCGSQIEIKRGIKIASIYKSNDEIKIKYRDEKGEETNVLAVLLSVGISRMIWAVSENKYDDKGIIWPFEIAPFEVVIVPVSVKDELQVKVAHEIYNKLKEKGMDVLLDDRDERAGVKFNDADLLGIPVRITIGKKINDGFVELKFRNENASKDVKIEDFYGEIEAFLLK
ncbi:proline--tRNA ligase [Caloramator sp. E03]|uniref:proline--tRNA ligase n=1 Tax=Caloramator sp. E03 TaxID=2576307 RepID=UPI00111044E1|nr:proline--tRNA ligase [Caloramator sp. E03]QCX33812.1 proline--tRNA ligase [Caloramator sp. E03]